MIRCVAILCSLLWAAPASASDALTLREVLDSSARSHPQLAAADSLIDEQRGRQLAATSAFEPRVKGDAQVLPFGYYQYGQWTAAVEQTIPESGVRARAGYRQGLGNIPPYYFERATRTGGEVFAALEAPLLANRSIDKPRAELRKAKLGIETSRSKRAETALKVTRDATVAYWQWVATGRVLQVSRELVTIANDRAERISAQAERGARPRIEIVDARRQLLARQSDALAAESDFAKAQARLSLYYRDDQRNPITAPIERLPITPEPPVTTREVLGQSIDALIAEAVRQRPEMKLLALAAQQAKVDLDLATNQRLPNLDARLFVARDLGPGSDVPADTDIGFGLSFSLPVFRRQARGDTQRARAKLAKIAAEQRGLRDRIAADLRAYARALELADARARLAQDRLAAAETMASAERARLAQGASDLLRVNLRERDVARAARDAIDAAFKRNRAVADLLYARGRSSMSE